MGRWRIWEWLVRVRNELEIPRIYLIGYVREAVRHDWELRGVVEDASSPLGLSRYFMLEDRDSAQPSCLTSSCSTLDIGVLDGKENIFLLLLLSLFEVYFGLALL